MSSSLPSSSSGSAGKYYIPKPVWVMEDAEDLEEEETWSVSQHLHIPTSSTSFRVTAGNKKYSLSASSAGEFDSTKKVISDLSMFKKYR